MNGGNRLFAASGRMAKLFFDAQRLAHAMDPFHGCAKRFTSFITPVTAVHEREELIVPIPVEAAGRAMADEMGEANGRGVTHHRILVAQGGSNNPVV